MSSDRPSFTDKVKIALKPTDVSDVAKISGSIKHRRVFRPQDTMKDLMMVIFVIGPILAAMVSTRDLLEIVRTFGPWLSAGVFGLRPEMWTIVAVVAICSLISVGTGTYFSLRNERYVSKCYGNVFPAIFETPQGRIVGAFRIREITTLYPFKEDTVSAPARDGGALV